MNPQDILFSKGIRVMLEANGRLDASQGVDMHTGWQETATVAGFDPHGRTPAREAYEDGYYSYVPNGR